MRPAAQCGRFLFWGIARVDRMFFASSATRCDERRNPGAAFESRRLAHWREPSPLTADQRRIRVARLTEVCRYRGVRPLRQVRSNDHGRKKFRALSRKSTCATRNRPVSKHGWLQVPIPPRAGARERNGDTCE